MQPSLVGGLGTAVENTLVGFVEFLPTLLGAALLVVLGTFLGRKLEPIVANAGRRVELDEKVRETPFEALFPDGRDAVSSAFAVLVKYYVVAIGAFVALEWTLIRTAGVTTRSTTDVFRELFGYVPPILIGVLVLFVGFYLANWATEEVRDSAVAAQFGMSPLFAGATKAVLYFVVLVIGLDTMGVDVTILHTFARAFAYGAGLALALAVGIAFGWGGKDFVAENIDDWFATSKPAGDESTAVTGDD